MHNQTLTLKEFNDFYEFIQNNSQNAEYDTCMSLEECQSSKHGKNLSSPESQSEDKTHSYLNDSKSLKNDLKSHLLNEKNVKNRFEPPN